MLRFLRSCGAAAAAQQRVEASHVAALARDADVEGLSDGFDERTAYGYIDGIDDPGMGWARYAQTVRIFVLNSGLFYIRPSPRTARARHPPAPAHSPSLLQHSADVRAHLAARARGADCAPRASRWR